MMVVLAEAGKEKGNSMSAAGITVRSLTGRSPFTRGSPGHNPSDQFRGLAVFRLD